MPIDLQITATTVEEFDELLARFSRPSVDGVMPEILTAATLVNTQKEPVNTQKEPVDEKPVPVRGRKTKAAEPTQQPDGTPIEPIHTPAPQPTPGGTDAPPAESIPPKQEGNADAATSAQSAAGTGSSTNAVDTSSATAETVAAAPAATSPADQGAAEQGEVTVQHLKDAMADLLKAKSASMAMQVLNEVAGCKSLTSGSPNVVEKAKEDPTLMRRVLDALVAAKTAA